MWMMWIVKMEWRGTWDMKRTSDTKNVETNGKYLVAWHNYLVVHLPETFANKLVFPTSNSVFQAF